MITPNSPLKDNIELEKDIIDILYTNINCVNTIYTAYNSTKISNNDSFVIVFAIKFLEITILEHLHIKYGNFKTTILNNSKILSVYIVDINNESIYIDVNMESMIRKAKITDLYK